MRAYRFGLHQVSLGNRVPYTVACQQLDDVGRAQIFKNGFRLTIALTTEQHMQLCAGQIARIYAHTQPNLRMDLALFIDA